MKCWRCEKEITDGTRECLYCRADQRRAEPVTEPGKALRQLYDRYGAKAALGNPMLLPNGIGDVISDSLMLDIKKFKNQLKTAMDAGMGRFYLEQLETVGKPDPAFDARVKMLLTEDAGLNDKTAENLAGWFDEMIGWKPAPKPSVQPVPQPAAKPSPEIDRQQIYEKAVHLMASGGIAGCKDALDMLEQIRGYKDTDDLIRQCRTRIAEPTPPSGIGTSTGSREKPSQKFIWAAAAVIAIIAFILWIGLRNGKSKKLYAGQTQQAIYATQTPDPDFDIQDGVLRKYRGNNSVVTIPDSVTSIGSYAFKECSSLTSISIPDSVTSIGDYAFRSCINLTSVTIPGNVAIIGEGTFSSCSSLTSITIPNSVTSIGDRAFDGCYSLTSITIPGSVTSIGDSAFYNCINLTSITIPGSVTSIGDSAFLNCVNLTSVTIPDSVVSIGKWAFYVCTRLTSVTIPNSVSYIGESAFDPKSLLNVRQNSYADRWCRENKYKYECNYY